MWEFRKRAVLRLCRETTRIMGSLRFPCEAIGGVLINPYVEKTRKDFLRLRVKRKGSNHFTFACSLSSVHLNCFRLHLSTIFI